MPVGTRRGQWRGGCSGSPPCRVPAPPALTHTQRQQVRPEASSRRSRPPARSHARKNHGRASNMTSGKKTALLPLIVAGDDSPSPLSLPSGFSPPDVLDIPEGCGRSGHLPEGGEGRFWQEDKMQQPQHLEQPPAQAEGLRSGRTLPSACANPTPGSLAVPRKGRKAFAFLRKPAWNRLRMWVELCPISSPPCEIHPSPKGADRRPKHSQLGTFSTKTSLPPCPKSGITPAPPSAAPQQERWELALYARHIFALVD